MPTYIDKGAPLRVIQKLVESATLIGITTAGSISVPREQIIIAGEVALLFGGTGAMEALLEQCRLYSSQHPAYQDASQKIECTWLGHITEWAQARMKAG